MAWRAELPCPAWMSCRACVAVVGAAGVAGVGVAELRMTFEPPARVSIASRKWHRGARATMQSWEPPTSVKISIINI